MIERILFDGLWQGGIIVALSYAITRTIPARSASTRYALWFAALLAIVAVPIATSVSDAGARLLAAFTAHSTRAGYTIALLPAGPYAAHARGWLEGVTPWVLLAWLIGVAFNIARLAWSFVRVERIGRLSQPLDAVASDVYVSGEVDVPIVAGIIAPRIVIPEDLPLQLLPAQLQQIVAHERAHVARKDPFHNLIVRAVEAALFFNPWIRIAAGVVSNEREVACDDWVVAKGGNADEYARCLAALAEKLRSQKLPLLSAGAYRSRHAIVRRIERLGVGGPRRLTVNAYALGGTIVIFIAVTLALQAFSPATAATSQASAGFRAASVRSSLLAASCANPNSDAKVVDAVPPSLPHGAKASGVVNALVTIAPSGHVMAAKVQRSSGNAAIDDAVLAAARKSTYSAKVVDCAAVGGQYVFHVEFAPNP